MELRASKASDRLAAALIGRHFMSLIKRAVVGRMEFYERPALVNRAGLGEARPMRSLRERSSTSVAAMRYDGFPMPILINCISRNSI
jgi:hypothetical protein